MFSFCTKNINLVFPFMECNKYDLKSFFILSKEIKIKIVLFDPSCADGGVSVDFWTVSNARKLKNILFTD